MTSPFGSIVARLMLSPHDNVGAAGGGGGGGGGGVGLFGLLQPATNVTPTSVQHRNRRAPITNQPDRM